MKTRLITAFVAFAIFVPFLIYSGTWMFAGGIAFLAVVGSLEMLRCVGTLKKWVISIPLLLTTACFVPLVYAFDSVKSYLPYAIRGVLIAMLWLLAVTVFSKGKISVNDVAVSAFGCFYITVAFASVLFLRKYSVNGAYTYLLIFIGAWVTDSMAYFTGILFGKHKLIPEISPKKTVEGSVGGIVFCALAFLLYSFILTKGFDVQLPIRPVLLILYGIITSVVSQIGDLSMSAIKRTYGIKDFGRIFPGHGGVLDRFDSILAVSTVLFVLNEFSGIYTEILK